MAEKQKMIKMYRTDDCPSHENCVLFRPLILQVILTATEYLKISS